MIYDVIVVGGGPAGLTAAVYVKRAGKSVLVIEKAAFGGQITWSPLVENFPAMGPVSGTDLGDLMTNRALELGAETEVGEVVALKKEGDLFTVTTDFDEEYQGRSVIIATGARPKTLGLPEEEQYQGNGECFCAVCDGAFYKDKVVAVCGGGNAALQDAAYLAELCRKVYLIHRRDTFRGEPVMVEKLRGMDNVEMVLGYQVKELLGGENLSGIRLEDASGQSKDLVVDGVFVAIGHSPANEAFREWIELDEKGYADAGEDCVTKTPGIFVAGDNRKKTIRQLTTAAADGAVAALAACQFLDQN